METNPFMNIVEINEQGDTIFTMSAGGQVRAWTVAIDGTLIETHVNCALREES